MAINIQYNTTKVVQYSCKVIIFAYVRLSCAIMYISRCSGSKSMIVDGWKTPGQKKQLSHSLQEQFGH